MLLVFKVAENLQCILKQRFEKISSRKMSFNHRSNEHAEKIIFVQDSVFLRKFQNNLLRASLITIYKSFNRPYLDYVFNNQFSNSSFHQKLGNIQYSAALALIGATRGISREKIRQELMLESLQQRQW